MNAHQVPDAFIWTKMQADAGQSIDIIRNRKELERRAGNGIFWWGIGESKARAIELLRRTKPRPVVLFSLMLTRPHAQSSGPSRVFLWRNYRSSEGEKPLPNHVVVISGPDRNGREKDRYYALLCHSGSSILRNGGGMLDAATLRNRGGAYVGSSQVTAVVEQGPPKSASSFYPITARATLAVPCAVSLTAPRELSLAEKRMLDEVGREGKVPADWIAVAAKLRLS